MKRLFILSLTTSLLLNFHLVQSAYSIFPREYFGGCSKTELKIFEKYGINIYKSHLHCAKSNSVQKRGCSFVYNAHSACCSPHCNWIMEFYCMHPKQMLCYRRK